MHKLLKQHQRQNQLHQVKTLHVQLICVLGGIIFGIYSMNYEHLFSNPHGLVVRFDYEAIPKSYTDASIESSGVGFTLNYRYHLSKQMKSVFIGLYSRYKIYSGNGMQESTEFDFTFSELTFGLNVGKRWVWNSGFNLTFSLGYGIANEIMESDPTSDAIKSTLETFKGEYDFFGPFLGELSIGYAF